MTRTAFPVMASRKCFSGSVQRGDPRGSVRCSSEWPGIGAWLEMTGDRRNGVREMVREMVFMQFHIGFHAEMCSHGKNGPIEDRFSDENREFRRKPYVCLGGFVYPHKRYDKIMTFL